MSDPEIASREEVLAMLTQKARKGSDQRDDRARAGARGPSERIAKRSIRARSHPHQVRPVESIRDTADWSCGRFQTEWLEGAEPRIAS